MDRGGDLVLIWLLLVYCCFRGIFDGVSDSDLVWMWSTRSTSADELRACCQHPFFQGTIANSNFGHPNLSTFGNGTSASLRMRHSRNSVDLFFPCIFIVHYQHSGRTKVRKLEEKL